MEKHIAQRLSKFRSILRRRKIASAFISDVNNVRYLSGFGGDSSALLITPSDAILITDFRYVEQAEAQCRGFEIRRRKVGVIPTAAECARRMKVASLAFEYSSLTFDLAQRMTELLNGIPSLNLSGVLDEQRMVKEPAEISAIRECIAVTEKALAHIRTFLVPGIRELDIAAEIEYFVRRQGFDGMFFPPIVAFGERGSLPHAQASIRRLKPGEPILVDVGVAGRGYGSDLTRVYFHNKIPRRFERIYRVVHEAQARAIRRIRPGVPARNIDRAARDCIRKAGFGRRFGHSLGHGLGMQVHEAPSISETSSTVLRKGMVFTVEPGIYIPGLGGVRIEDDVLVTAAGIEVLSNAPKRLEDVLIET